MWSTASVIHVSENVDESLNHISRNKFWKKHLLFIKCHTPKKTTESYWILISNKKNFPKKFPNIFRDLFFFLVGRGNKTSNITSIHFLSNGRWIWKNGASDLPMGYFSETPAEATSTWRYETTSIFPVKISMKRVFPGKICRYGWWFRNPKITTWDVYNYVNNGAFSIWTGFLAGIQPSTIGLNQTSGFKFCTWQWFLISTSLMKGDLVFMGARY